MPKKIYFVKSREYCPVYRCKEEVVCKYDEKKRLGNQSLCEKKQIISHSCRLYEICSTRRKNACPPIQACEKARYLP